MKRIRKTERINVMLNDFMNQEKISDGIFNVKINEAWKNASEELYKAQSQNAGPDSNQAEPKSDDKKDDDVQDVDFEEVK